MPANEPQDQLSQEEGPQECHTIVLSERDSQRFLRALDSKELPNESLRRAAEQYKQKFPITKINELGL